MKIYFAGPWADRLKVEKMALELESMGHIIVQRWWEDDFPKASPEVRQRCAQGDYDSVREADLLLVWNTVLSEGKAVEQGLAMAWEKPIICIIPEGFTSQNIFHNMLDKYTHVTSFEEAISQLDHYAELT